MSECADELRDAGKASPRTCAICGLGPCHKKPLPENMKPEVWVEKTPADFTDAELADAIRNHVGELNKMADYAHKRELIISYRIKAPDGANPRLIAMVMTEVA